MKRIVLNTYLSGLVIKLCNFGDQFYRKPEMEDHILLENLKTLDTLIQFAIKKLEKKVKSGKHKKVKLGSLGSFSCFECGQTHCSGNCDTEHSSDVTLGRDEEE